MKGMKKEENSCLHKANGGGYLENTTSLILKENKNNKNKYHTKVTNVASFFIQERRG